MSNDLCAGILLDPKERWSETNAAGGDIDQSMYMYIHIHIYVCAMHWHIQDMEVYLVCKHTWAASTHGLQVLMSCQHAKNL